MVDITAVSRVSIAGRFADLGFVVRGSRTVFVFNLYLQRHDCVSEPVTESSV